MEVQKTTVEVADIQLGNIKAAFEKVCPRLLNLDDKIICCNWGTGHHKEAQLL